MREKKSFFKANLKFIIPIAFLLLFIVTVIIFRSSLIPGWYTDGQDKYYLKAPFSRASGLERVGEKDYVFSDYGTHGLKYGWVKADGLQYYTDKNGEVVKGEYIVDGVKYNFDSETGVLYKNEMRIIDGKLWYFGEDGFKRFGIVDLGDKSYYFNETGNLRKGFVTIDGKKYYFQPNEGPDKESMLLGFQNIDGETYCFGPDGAALTGKQVIDGINYEFDQEGRLVN